MSLQPDFETFLSLAASNPGKLIPVTRRFLADGLTPVAAYRRLPPSDYAFLLESVERGERIGRYSFVGSSPDVVFRGSVVPKPHYSIEKSDSSIETHNGDVVVALENYLRNRAVARSATAVPPFSGGAVGYLGYDITRLFEPRLMQTTPAREGIGGVPDLVVPIYRTILAFDHVMNTAAIVHHVDPREFQDAKTAYASAQDAIDCVSSALRRPAADPLDEIEVRLQSRDESSLKSNTERAGYLRAVAKAKEYIAAGDIIQVVLSQRLRCQTRAHPFEIYRSLRAINPSPYMFYLRMGGLHVVGSSPEVMVRVENSEITVRPIAGTRRRGQDAAEDARLAAELLTDPKERAEHVMLLDLGRNDVGRVSDFASVRVTEQMVIENYSHVMHIVSNVSGRMRGDLNAFDVFRSCVPAGTVSGAPKIRAMEIIDELEPDRRGPYAGAVGVIDFLGNLNTAIAIRTFVLQESANGEFDAHVQAGAGIVADSVPETEYEETMNKARALLRALEAAEARLGISINLR